MKTRNVFICTIAVLILGACANGNGAGDSSQRSQSVGVAALQGNWTSTCTPTTIGNSGGNTLTVNQINSLNFNGETLTMLSQIYSASDCSSGLWFEMKIIGNYTRSSSLSSNPQIINVDGSINSFSEALFDQDTVNAMNSNSFCGFSNWVVGVFKDVTGSSCMSGSGAGKKGYSIVKVTGNQMQMGMADSTHDGSTPDKRFVTLDPTVYQRN